MKWFLRLFPKYRAHELRVNRLEEFAQIAERMIATSDSRELRKSIMRDKLIAFGLSPLNYDVLFAQEIVAGTITTTKLSAPAVTAERIP